MARGNAEQTKVIYHGTKTSETYIVMVSSPADLEAWKADSSIPLAQVVDGWKVFITHKQGAQGIMDAASNAALENEFGTSKEEEVVQKILRDGSVQVKTNPERQGDRNESMGTLGGH
ncbi:ribosome maturation protein [Geopyxis carbonaria]|nr:ribosome maturation protein [Geopyxis carbonaria]